jgi:hypothetical protein
LELTVFEFYDMTFSHMMKHSHLCPYTVHYWAYQL